MKVTVGRLYAAPRDALGWPRSVRATPTARRRARRYRRAQLRRYAREAR